MLEKVNQYIITLSETIPLELFTVIGSFLEDIFAPIPSPLVTTAAGTIAQAQGYGFIWIFVLAVIASIGKTIACIIIYIVADKAEDFLLQRVGPKIGLNHKQIEKIGSYFTESSKDYAILTVIRALPIIPSLPVSVVAGVIKLPMKLYIVATLVGTFFRSLLFIYIGYAGLSAYQHIVEGIDSIESMIQIGMVVILVGIVGWFYYKRSKNFAE